MTTKLLEEASKLQGDTAPKDTQEHGTALARLVGEGKKFGTEEDLAKGKLESDDFIKRLQTENEELRTDLQGKLQMEEFITEMRTRQAPQEKVSNPDTQKSGEDNEVNPLVDVHSLTEEDVQKLITNTVLQREENNTRDVNRATSLEALKKHYGAGSQEALSQKILQLGISEERLDDLASTSPAAFKELMGITTPKVLGDTAPPRTTLETIALGDGVNPKKLNPDNPKTMADFNEMRRTNPRLYHNKQTQVLLHSMAQNDPDNFFS